MKSTVYQILSSTKQQIMRSHLITIEAFPRSYMNADDILDVMTAYIISRSPNLQHVSFADGFLHDATLTPIVLSAMVNNQTGIEPALDKVQSVHLELRDHNNSPTPRVLARFVGPFLNLPKVSKLSLHNLGSRRVGDTPSAKYMASLNRKMEGWTLRTSEALTSLDLSDPPPEFLEHIVQFTPNLKTLSYRIT